MASLTSCMKKAGKALRDEDRADILARFNALTESGAATAEAARMAVDEQIAKVQGMLGGEVAAVEPASPAAPATALDAFKATMQAVYNGTATVEDYQAGYARVRDETAMKAELGKMTKDELTRMFGIMRDGKKDELVAMAYSSMLRNFALGKEYGPSGGYMMTRNGMADYEAKKRAALDELVAGQTADDLAAFAAEQKRISDERAGKRAALVEAVKDPKTLDDFRNHERLKLSEGMSGEQARLSLTPEQRALRDELAAEVTRGRRKQSTDEQRTTVRAAGQTTAGEIIATKHTRDGHNLWVVKLSDRVSKDDYVTLLAGAKRLGGNYSSFRGNGAVPGFQFRTPDAAQAFLKLAGGDPAAATEVAQERRNAFEDDRSQSAAERLTEMADRLEERADESLGRDRKANTARRARFAASAEAGARNLKAMAKTMRNVADALTSGKAKFLDRIRTRTQVELLQTYVKNAYYDELRAKYATYVEQQKHEGDPPTAETADYAQFPEFTAYRSDLASLGRQLQEVDGTKKLGDRLMKVADDVSDAFTAWAKEPGNLLRLSAFSVRSGEDVKTAIFKDRETAERSIKRSGLSGKAIVFPEKRGVNRIIMSPSEAIAKGIWQGDGDKRITLSDDFGTELVEQIGRVARRNNKLTVPWQFERAHERRKQLQRMGIETPAEFRAALREFIGLREVAAEPDKVKQMERAMIGRRNDGLDFFPTPESVADEMVAAADIQPGMRVLEPSAGMGHIAERIRATEVEPDVAEFSNDRKELLEAKGFNVVARDFMDLTEGGYDRILMNPPFSDGRDIQHVRHAYDLLKPGGRVVAIMGESAFFNQNKRATEFREWLDSVGGTSEKLPEGTFNDPSLPVNTGANARMVVIEKPAGEQAGDGAAQFSRAPGVRAGVPLADAEAVADAIRAAYPTGPQIVVLDDVRKAPEQLLDQIRAVQAANTVEGAYYKGKIYLFPQNVADIQRLMFVGAHHEIRHAGLDALFGKRKGALLLSIAMSNPKVAAAARAKMADGLADSMVAATEEALADMPLEDMAKLNGWNKIVAAVRQWLRGMADKLRRNHPKLAAMIEPDQWTDNDVAALIRRAEDISRGGTVPARPGGAVFARAYHGTPYRGIDKFSTDAIGTGEGVQAYGWGLYFASKREVADFYRRKLSGESDRVFTKDGRTIQGPADLAEAYYQPGRIVRGYGGADKVLEFRRTDDGGWSVKVVGVKANGEPMQFERPRWHATQPDGNALRDVLEEDGWRPSQAGQLYEVEVPEDSELLLWDKPLSEQPAKVREAMQQAIEKMDDENAEVARRQGDALRGSNAYTLLSTSDRVGGQREASQVLADAGIKGIKYLDGTSRDGRGNGHNYVIFSGDDVAIQQALFSRADQTQTPDARRATTVAVDGPQAAARQIAEAIKTAKQDDPYATYALRVLPSEQSGAQPGDALPESYVWADGEQTDETLDGASAIAISGDDAAAVMTALRNLGVMGRPPHETPNGVYMGKRVALVKGDRTSAGEDVGEVVVRDAQVVALWDRSADKWGPIKPNEPTAPEFGGAVFSRAGTAKTTAQRQVTQAVRNTVSDLLGNAGAKVSFWDRTLGTQYAKAQKFPAYKRVFDAVQQYLEDTSAMANEAADQAKGILPKLETWKDLKNFGLKPADAKAIAAPIFEGTLTDQKVYDDAELAGRFKLTPAQIAQYKEFRAAVNTSLDQAMAAEALRMLGDKNAALRELALTDREALRAGVLQYLYQQAVKAGEDLDAQGADRGEFTKLRDDIAEKYDRIDSLKAQGYAPLMRFGQYKLNITDRETGETLFFCLYESKAAANAALRDMQGDPEFQGAEFEQGVLSKEQYKLFSAMPLDSLEMFAQAIGADQSEVFQDFIRLAKSNRSAMKRLLKRKGTAGFSEDVPRVLAAFVTSNARMAAGALNMPTAKEAAQDIRDGDVQDEAIKLLDVVQNPTDTAGAVRGLMFVNFIGGSIASAVVNLTQPLTMTLPYLSQFGGGMKAAKRLMAAGKMAASGKVDDLALRVALKRAETDGIVSPQEIHHLQSQAMGTFGTHPLLQRAAFIWGAPFSLAEQFNRRVSFIAAFNTAREQGIEDPFSFAEKAVVETQGLYNKGNAPNLARGTIGAAALTFKQFSIHYLEWMGRMWKSGPQGKKAVGLALALLILAAGTDGLPFADDLDDLIDTLGQALGYDMNVKRARREFVAEQLGMGDAAADVMARGFSAVPGIPLDVSIRMSMGNLLPGTGMFLRSNTDKSRDLLEIAGPAGGLAKQYIEAGTKALKGDFSGAVQSALPVAFQNAFKGVGMWTTGEARDTLGRKVMDADEVDGLMKFIGFQPQAIARESEKIQMIRNSEQLAKNVEGEIASAWARAIVDKDADGVADARAKLAQWNEDNPEAPIRIKMQQIISRAKKLREDRASRFITSVAPERRRAVAEALE